MLSRGAPHVLSRSHATVDAAAAGTIAKARIGGGKGISLVSVTAAPRSGASGKLRRSRRRGTRLTLRGRGRGCGLS